MITVAALYPEIQFVRDGGMAVTIVGKFSTI
jgi:hypothetical protein